MIILPLLALFLIGVHGIGSIKTDSPNDQHLLATKLPKYLQEEEESNKAPQNQEPIVKQETEWFSTSPLSTEMQEVKDLFTIDYHEASRRGRTDVTINLVPTNELIASLPKEINVFIEYNKRIRRVRKVWGGKVLIEENTVHFTTELAAKTFEKILSFGYTIDYKGRNHNPSYPIFMDIRMVDDAEF